MNTLEHLKTMRTMIDHCIEHYPTAENRARLDRPDTLKAAGGEGGGGERSAVEALVVAGRTRDMHAEFTSATTGEVRRSFASLATLKRMIDAKLPRVPDAKAKREAAIANHQVVSCAHCTSVRARMGKPLTYMYRAGDVGGRLPEPMPLCRFCYDHVIKTEEQMGAARLPLEEEIRANVNGKNVTHLWAGTVGRQ